MRLTVGPLPPAVYWRRRALVLAAVLVVLFLVAQAFMAPASPEEAAGPPTDSPSPPPADPPPTGASPDGVPVGGNEQPGTGATPAQRDSPEPLDPRDEDACTDEEMQITAEAERTELPSGSPVGFTIKLKNVSDRTCRRDVGADLQELYLVQGTGTLKVWSSDDCGAARGNDVRDLPPAHERSYSVTWNGRSSAECGGQPAAPTGAAPPPGEYLLIGRLGTAYSEPLQITLT